MFKFLPLDTNVPQASLLVSFVAEENQGNGEWVQGFEGQEEENHFLFLPTLDPLNHSQTNKKESPKCYLMKKSILCW